MDSLKNYLQNLESLVVQGEKRKYYRFRPAPFYGGIATADCVGCPLNCVFCWSSYPRTHPQTTGKWYTPQQVFDSLTDIAQKKGFSQVRVSGNEPTVGRVHLMQLLEKVKSSPFQFILETSGILLDREYVEFFSHIKNLHVRVSLKGTCEKEFAALTGGTPEGFRSQLRALQLLVEHEVSCHPAVMVSFSSNEGLRELKERLSSISPRLYLEEEQVILYPQVKSQLQKAGFMIR
ncbi:MAG: radical SAM protein [Theionarchaea archaeon]|nr:radical SAM protein [Theionarchaea archaeon]